jgi:mannose-6-phosphate isomerase-like protein (cupin superfamily)
MIFIKDEKNCTYFQAGDRSLLCELLHPEREAISLQMGFSLARAIIKPDQRTQIHQLKTSSEIFYILQGEGVIQIEKEEKAVLPGQVIYIPPGDRQCLRNTGSADLIFLCLVSPPWNKEDEVVYEPVTETESPGSGPF